MKKILLSIYKYVYGVEFNYKMFDDRLKMQKAVYLLENEGVHIGGYQFMWYKYGPYSQELQDDCHNMIEASITSLNDINKLPAFVQAKLEVYKNFVSAGNKTNYPVERWVELGASLHYLRKYIVTDKSDEALLAYLVRVKPQLDNMNDNAIALDYCKKVFM